MFGVHWVWILLMLMALVTITAVIVGAIAFASRNRPQVPAPVVSPDGRLWWDGREWRPMPEPGTPPTP